MVICIVGPTGVGKTKLSIELAKLLNGEIINSDSTQIYKGLNIATAKVTEEQKEGIPHHLFDIKDITEDYTVFDYQKDAREKLENILERGKTPIVVGGTGLYINALLYDYKFEQEKDNNEYLNYSNEELYKMLKEIDNNTPIHPNNRKRIIRALNHYNNTGKLLGHQKNNKLLYDTIFIGLTTKRDILYEKINKRVDKMIEDGLVEEAKKLYNSNIRTKAVMTPIGYKELFEYFCSNITFEKAIDLIKQRSRRYAKRQYTWFNNQMNVNWINVDFENFNNTVKEAIKIIK